MKLKKKKVKTKVKEAADLNKISRQTQRNLKMKDSNLIVIGMIIICYKIFAGFGWNISYF